MTNSIIIIYFLTHLVILVCSDQIWYDSMDTSSGWQYYGLSTASTSTANCDSTACVQLSVNASIEYHEISTLHYHNIHLMYSIKLLDFEDTDHDSCKVFYSINQIDWTLLAQYDYTDNKQTYLEIKDMNKDADNINSVSIKFESHTSITRTRAHYCYVDEVYLFGDGLNERAVDSGFDVIITTTHIIHDSIRSDSILSSKYLLYQIGLGIVLLFFLLCICLICCIQKKMRNNEKTKHVQTMTSSISPRQKVMDINDGTDEYENEIVIQITNPSSTFTETCTPIMSVMDNVNKHKLVIDTHINVASIVSNMIYMSDITPPHQDFIEENEDEDDDDDDDGMYDNISFEQHANGTKGNTVEGGTPCGDIDSDDSNSSNTMDGYDYIYQEGDGLDGDITPQ